MIIVCWTVLALTRPKKSTQIYESWSWSCQSRRKPIIKVVNSHLRPRPSLKTHTWGTLSNRPYKFFLVMIPSSRWANCLKPSITTPGLMIQWLAFQEITSARCSNSSSNWLVAWKATSCGSIQTCRLKSSNSLIAFTQNTCNSSILCKHNSSRT